MRSCMKFLSVTAAVLLVLLVALCGCRHSPQGRVHFGMSTKADLLVVFKAGVSQNDINQFIFDHLEIGDLEKGFWPRPGVGSILQASVSEHDGYVVYFRQDATPEQRRQIK